LPAEIGRDVGDVLAVVGGFRPVGVARLQALAAGTAWTGQGADLHAGVVVIELAQHLGALALQQVADAVAQRRVAAVAHVQRAGGVGGDELHHHLASAGGWRPKRSARGQHLGHHGLFGGSGQAQVDEARAGDFQRLHPALHRRLLLQRGHQGLGQSRGFFLRLRAIDMAAVMARSPCAACLGDSNAAAGALAPDAAATSASADCNAPSRACFASIMARFYFWALPGIAGPRGGRAA
jgi:hypothetical protein